MTNDERDTMISATHDAVIVMVKDVKDHDDTLYGESGLKKAVTLLQERQNQCPARRASTTENKKLNVAIVMMALTTLSLFANFGWNIWNAIH